MTEKLLTLDEIMALPSNTMDAEAVALCEAMNKMPGIYTTESCCGHGQRPFKIWFVTESLEALPPLLYYFDACHCGHHGWQVIARTDCAMKPVSFMAEGPVGEEAYKGAEVIARLIEEHVAQEAV